MTCLNDNDCLFLHHCLENGKCQHDSVFPLSAYTVFIYLLIPLAIGLVNSTGNSMGVFKVSIVMNLLRYESTQATMITQAMVVGTALPNYFSILFRKHPTMQTSLVNFNLVFILVPCCLLGSTFGTLIGGFIPIIGQDILIILVFSYFSSKFYNKYKSLKNLQKETKLSLASQNQNQVDNLTHKSMILQNKQMKILQNSSNFQITENNQTDIKTRQTYEGTTSKQLQKFNEQKAQILSYQKSIHGKDIIVSVIVFIVFQFFVFLVQGKLPFLQFKHCQIKYVAGLIILVCMTATYVFVIKKILIKRYAKYEQFNIVQQIYLNKNKQFNLVVAAGLTAGLVQGVLGIGSGNCIMTFLHMTSVSTTTASAISGYQVLFVGLAALAEGFINEEVDIVDSSFFIVLCVVLGGLVTLGINYFLRKIDQNKVSRILVLVVCILCLMSVIMIIPSVLLTYYSSGWQSLIQIRFRC